MKAAIKICILFIVLNAGSWLAPQKASAQVSVSFQLFYDDLSPYGNWVDNTDYGYVWVPNVSAGFTPYGTNGHWVFTNAGWTWYSDYAWGWAPFHYGRWYSDPVYGPMWVPGNEWGPGWVTWRSSEGYYGWAPIGPGISIDIAYGNSYSLPYNQWTFVRDRDFGRNDINNYYVDRSTNTTIINNSTVINNIQSANSGGARYNAGPQQTDVEKRAGKSFTPVAIKESNTPGQKLNNNNLEIYKPRVENAAGHKAAPTKVANLKDVKPAAERKAESQPKKENQPVKTQPAQHQQNAQPARQQPSQQPRDNQPKKEQPAQRQQNTQPAKQQPSQQPRDNQPKREQPAQRQQNAQPAKQQPSQQQHDNQPKREQPAQHQQNAQPERQQPRDNRPNKEQPKQQPTTQPDRQPPPQQPKRSAHPNEQQQPEHQQQQQQPNPQSDPPKNNGEEKKPH